MYNDLQFFHKNLCVFQLFGGNPRACREFSVLGGVLRATFLVLTKFWRRLFKLHKKLKKSFSPHSLNFIHTQLHKPQIKHRMMKYETQNNTLCHKPKKCKIFYASCDIDTKTS